MSGTKFRKDFLLLFGSCKKQENDSDKTVSMSRIPREQMYQRVMVTIEKHTTHYIPSSRFETTFQSVVCFIILFYGTIPQLQSFRKNCGYYKIEKSLLINMT